MLCRFPEGNSDFAKQNRPVLGVIVLPLNPFKNSVYGKKSLGQGWDVVERHISGQKGYEKTDTVPVVVIDKEKEKAHKTWYTSLYNKLFGGKHQKFKKSRSCYSPKKKGSLSRWHSCLKAGLVLKYSDLYICI